MTPGHVNGGCRPCEDQMPQVSSQKENSRKIFPLCGKVKKSRDDLRQPPAAG
jgi:hypothetical protein